MIIFSSKNIASRNIAKFIDGRLDIFDVNDSITNFKPPKADFYIVLSSHTAKSGIPSATVHVPGNWGKALLGGIDNKLCPSFPSLMLNILKRYSPLAERGYEITYEVDHHGPYFDKPVMFVELGSSETYWNDEYAAKIIAEAVIEALDDPNRYPTYFGIGGTHYVEKLTKYSLQNNIAYTHLLAKYQIEGFNEDKFIDGLNLSIEPSNKIIVEKKGVTSDQKNFIMNFSSKYGVEIIFI